MPTPEEMKQELKQLYYQVVKTYLGPSRKFPSLQQLSTLFGMHHGTSASRRREISQVDRHFLRRGIRVIHAKAGQAQHQFVVLHEPFLLGSRCEGVSRQGQGLKNGRSLGCFSRYI